MKKPWHDKITAHIENWSGRLRDRDWWPYYVYFFADIINAVEILRSGCLLSRAEAEVRGVLKKDTAATTVICNTSEVYKRFVRFYYRPRTPTQYNNEGVRPANALYDGAHCPVPIFFLFDSFALMSAVGSYYSTMNVASPYATVGEGEDVFDLINFNKVFHVGPYNPETESDIKKIRCAELLVPGVVDFSQLRYIYCRSHAERDTFVHILYGVLSRDNFSALHAKIRIGNSSFFERRFAYVSSVSLTGDVLSIEFNSNNVSIEQLSCDFVFDYNGECYNFNKKYCPRGVLSIRLPKIDASPVLTIEIDGNLAYKNKILVGDMVF